MTTDESGSQLPGNHDVVVALVTMAVAVAGLEAVVKTGLVADLGSLAPARALLGVTLALFGPGYLLLLLARIEFRRLTAALVYVVGLSCAVLLTVAVVTDLVLGPNGLSMERPFVAVQWMFLGGLVLLGVAALLRPGEDRALWQYDGISTRPAFWLLLLCLLPLLALAGTRLLNGSGENSLALVVVALVAFVPVLIGTDVLPRELHPVAIWSVSLSILLGMTMITDHIWGWDVHFQYAIARTILNEGVWNPGFESSSNSLLTTTLLAAAYSAVTGLELVWVYKLVYAFLGSTLPVIVYLLGDRLFEDHRIAALGPFALMFYYGFFKFFPDKQLISLLFFALTLFALLDDETSGIRKRALSLVFAALMILSHYGVSLLFVAFLGLAGLGVAFVHDADVDDEATDLVRPTFVVLFAVTWYAWFRYSAGGANFTRILEVGYETIATFGGGGASERSGSGYVTRALTSPLWMIYTLLNAVLLGLVSIGVAESLTTLGSRERRVEPVYVAMGAIVLGFLVSSVVAIYGMGFDRTMLIALVVLAPFTLVGLRAIFRGKALVSGEGRVRVSRGRTAAILGVFLAVFLLFSSGTVFVLAGDTVPPYSINVDEDADWHTYEPAEIDATRWLERHGSNDRAVVVFNEGGTLKSRDGLLVVEVISRDRIELAWPSRTDFEGDAYVYVSERPQAVETDGPEREYLDPETTAFYQTHVVTADLVYSSESARIYSIRGSETAEDQPSESSSNAGDQSQQEYPVQRTAAADRQHRLERRQRVIEDYGQ